MVEYMDDMEYMDNGDNGIATIVTPEECAKLYSDKDKWFVAILFGFLFIIFASPWLFKFVNDVLKGLGIKISDDKGCPTGMGLVTHAVIFTLAVRLFLR